MGKAERLAERAYKRYKLDETLALFQQTHRQFGLRIVPNSTIGHTYVAEHTVPSWVARRENDLPDLGTIRVLVLGRSSEWYKYRLNTYANTIDAVVCATHDSCLPIPVFALDVIGVYYKSFKMRYYPLEQIPERFWHTERGHKMLVGALMCKVPEAERVLSRFKRSTRYRIELETRQLLLRKRGRPIAGASLPVYEHGEKKEHA